jgi:hypothetical protein
MNDAAWWARVVKTRTEHDDLILGAARNCWGSPVPNPCIGACRTIVDTLE